ncbi:MAG: sugar transferase [Actinobacteria bacterium]|nr:sugar transferase [Actinomycetota bacterium]
MLAKVRAVVESGVIAFLLFSSFALIYQVLDPRNPLAVILLISAHYITVLLCGYWAGWRARVDGWLFSLLGYSLFRLIYYYLPLKATLPFSMSIKLLGFLTILALLMFGAAIGEQRAHYVEGAVAEVNKTGLYPIVKRIADITIASIGLLLLAPIMLTIGIGIKLASPGPIFFHQTRIGQHGRIFKVIKFRTMRTDAERILTSLPEYQNRTEPFVKLREDPRVFPFGRFLRLSSLDELPQLINIMLGDMSIIGPRPLIPSEIEHCTEEQRRRLEVKPGLTGWAQINGRTDISFDELMRMDAEYISNQSFLFDLQILLRTVWKVLIGRGAY